MSDEKVLLFIDDSESFITKTIVKNLRAKGHACELVHLKVDQLTQYKDKVADYIFYNIADINSIDRMGLAYLKDVCLENGYVLYCMGYKDDIDIEMQGFPSKQLGTFVRTINAAQVSEDIDLMIRETPVSARYRHVLVVDDSGVMLNTIKEWLEPYYRVSLVNSATNALTFLANHRPDLILLDYEMPICSGPQLMEMIKSDPDKADIPIIFLTGKDDAESVRKVLALKPAGYLLKSRPKEEILKTIGDFFAKTLM